MLRPASLLIVPALLLTLASAGGVFWHFSTGIAQEPVAEVEDTDLPVLPEAAPPDVAIEAPLRKPGLALDPTLRARLVNEDWTRAADGLLALGPDAFPGTAKGDWAFLVAWSLVHAGRGAEAVPYLDWMGASPSVPKPYLALVRGEALLAADRDIEALEWLARVPEQSSLWGRASLARVLVLRELERTKEAQELLELMVARPDPAEGTPQALIALAQVHGGGSPEAYPLLRRVWVAYPRSEYAVAATKLLAAYPTRPTWQEVGQRAEALMDQREYVAAITETERVLSTVEGTGVDACRFAYARGRSYYKRNELSNALGAFGDLGERCDAEAAAWGAPMLYLKGQALYRKSQYSQAAEAFTTLAERFPEESLADDGLTQAGIALQQAGRLDEARVQWGRALDRFPHGDTAPEAAWRVAFSLYLEGRTDEARAMAVVLGELPLDGDHVHVAAGRYWNARWALYPDVTAPRTPEEAGRAEAIEGWAALCRDQPHSFYSILAYSRLVEEAPEVAAEVAVRHAAHDAGDLATPWRVRQVFLDDPAAAAAIGLMRLDLVDRSLEEWADVGEVTPQEMAWFTELRSEAGDWLFAHAAMRAWLRDHPPGTLGDAEGRVLRVAYPDRYWEEVQKASAGDRYEPRLLHALVREESNFNREITSFAGARGLSQLMPGTAAEVAGWMGRSVGDLTDPTNNLTLGARYFDSVHKSMKDSPYLSLAGYNAGPGRVRQWRGEWGDVPTDEYVERIPYKETRDYVRRVMGTWQTMRWQFDVDQPAFPDLSAFNHHALPE